MAESKSDSGGGGGLSHLTWFVAILVLMWFVWLITGGPERSKEEGIFVKPPAPIDTGTTYGTPSDVTNPRTYAPSSGY